MHFRRFLGSLIMNLKADLQNSNWRIQNSGQIFKKLLDFHKTCHSGGFGVTNYESGARFANFKMADPI